MIDTAALLKAAMEGVNKYIDQYNTDNDAQVAVSLADPSESDFGMIEIDGGGQHGAWVLELAEL